MMELTSAERMKALMNKEKLDRIPVNPNVTLYAANISNYSSKEYYMEPEKAFKAQMCSINLHKYDATPGYAIPEWQNWDFGGELMFSETPRIRLPKVIRRPIEDIKDVKNLKIPDVDTAPSAIRSLKFAKICVENGFGFSVPSGSPFGGVQSILGTELLLKSLRKDPEVIHHLLRMVTDYMMAITKKSIDIFGVEKISTFSAYPMESHGIISSKDFEKFSIPYIKEIQDMYQEWGIKKWIVHLCGDHKENLKYWTNELKLPRRTVFTLGYEMDMRETAEVLGDEYIIGGNVRNSIIHSGKPEDVYEESRKAIEQMKYSPGGFILMPDCALTPLAPACNVQAMVKAVEDFGRYD